MIAADELISHGIQPGTVASALSLGMQRLGKSGALRPRRHSELILETVLHKDRTTLYLDANKRLTADECSRFEELLSLRESGVPVQHIVGWAPFYGRKFLLGAGVFIPRFDSEIMIEMLVKRVEESDSIINNLEILDLCCGCGILGLTAACELPGSSVALIDNSALALEYTAKNAVSFGIDVQIEIKSWDALSEPPQEWLGRFDYILANPPYIAQTQVEGLHPDVKDGEPMEALTDFGDGLTFYEHWRRLLPSISKPGCTAFIEIGDGMTEMVCEVFDNKIIEVHKDLNGIERAVELRTSQLNQINRLDSKQMVRDI